MAPRGSPSHSASHERQQGGRGGQGRGRGPGGVRDGDSEAFHDDPRGGGGRGGGAYTEQEDKIEELTNLCKVHFYERHPLCS